jgi:hypothetical protein
VWLLIDCALSTAARVRPSRSRLSVSTGSGSTGTGSRPKPGVTDAIVVPWLLYGAGFDAYLRLKKDGLRRFADEIIAVMEGE